jgi:hypothetical protein
VPKPPSLSLFIGVGPENKSSSYNNYVPWRPAVAAAEGLGTPPMVFSIDESKPATDSIPGVPTGDDSDMISKKKS